MAQTLFNQPHPARAAVPWQPNAGIAQKLSSRGYATTRWGSEEPEDFANLGYPAKPSGFSADHYQPTKQSLSAQALASLALLEGEHRNESLGEEIAAAEGPALSNAHLPFVMDQFAATRKSALRVNVDSGVLKRALAHAEMAETLEVSPITSDEKIADPIVIVADVYEGESPEAAPPDLAQASAEDVLSEPEPEVVAADAEAAAALPEAPIAEVETTPEPALPAVVGGIDPDEVVQREAEQFANGLEQGRAEGAAALAQAVEDAKAEAFQEAYAQGKEEGRAEGIEEGRAQGHAEGEASAREAVAVEMAAQRVLFENTSRELQALLADSTQFFEPLKRLSLHIAEQVVMGELRMSSQAIERLVQRCLDELDHPVQGAVVVELHPEDKERMQTHAADLIQGMRLEAVQDLHPGSVRVFANDTVVEDLVEHRLAEMARALQIDEQAWVAKSVLTQEKEVEDDDVHS